MVLPGWGLHDRFAARRLLSKYKSQKWGTSTIQVSGLCVQGIFIACHV